MDRIRVPEVVTLFRKDQYSVTIVRGTIVRAFRLAIGFVSGPLAADLSVAP
jgi:hypothetical protein